MNLITLTDPRSPISEAYRTLRTNLSFYSLDAPIRTLVVAAPAPDPNKSLVAANLAVTLAQAGRKTILVDGDLRRPELHTLFNLNNEQGLTTLMLGENSDLRLQKSIDNLHILTSGPKPPNPADLLGSRQTDRIIETLTSQADIILFDAPPILGVTDAVVLGTKVDGVLLVITAGKTRRDQAERAKALLEKAKVRIIGATLTNAPLENVSGYYG